MEISAISASPSFLDFLISVFCKISAFATFSIFWRDFLRFSVIYYFFFYFRILSRFLPFPPFFVTSYFSKMRFHFRPSARCFMAFSAIFYFIEISAISAFPRLSPFGIALFPYFSMISVFSVFSYFRILALSQVPTLPAYS